MIHGDLWAGQILWRDENTIAGIIDWQGVRQGSPVNFTFFCNISIPLLKWRSQDKIT